LSGSGVKRTGQALADQPLAKGAGQNPDKGICREPAGIVKQVTLDRCPATGRVATERTGEAAAHSDAVKTAGETGDEDHRVVRHQVRRQRRRLLLDGQIYHPTEKGDGHDDEDYKSGCFGTRHLCASVIETLRQKY